MKKRIRFNILDIIIITVAVILVVGVSARGEIVELFLPDESEAVSYTLVLKGIPEMRAEYLLNGVSLYSSESGFLMGEITSVTKTVSSTEETTLNGTVVRKENTGYFDITLNVSAKAKIIDGNVYLDGEVWIVPGMEIQLATTEAVYYALVLSLD